MAGRQRAGSGHRTLPHTADLRVEAWAPTAEGCVEEAVRAVVDGFADVSAAEAVGERTCAVTAPSERDLLVSVLEEVLYRLDADGELPLRARVGPIRSAQAGLAAPVAFRMADARTAEPVGAVPKAVSLHGLGFGRYGGGWECRVTLDV